MGFLQQQWQQHTQAIRNQPRLRKRDLKQIFSIIPNDYIIHNEDHANAHLMVYCPNLYLYNQAAFNTWLDKDTFAVKDEDEDTIKKNMRKGLPQQVARKYKKILDFKKPLPYGYIMMKRKKEWNKGRTIVAYANTCIGPLLKMIAIAPQHAQHDVATALRQSHHPSPVARNSSVVRRQQDPGECHPRPHVREPRPGRLLHNSIPRRTFCAASRTSSKSTREITTMTCTSTAVTTISSAMFTQAKPS